VAPGYLQANLIILPSAYAGDFHALCLRNPVSCPLLGHTPEAGNPHKIVPEACITTSDFDLRTDFARYRVYEHGRFVTATTDLRDVWTADHVGFLIGCSFSFEDALTRNGLQPRHQLTNTLVAMYRSSIPVLPAGVFTGATCVVSMRPYRPEHVERVRALTRPYLSTHGEPVAWGWDGADAIGVKDVAKVDFGMPQRFEEGEVPVFWVSRFFFAFSGLSFWTDESTNLFSRRVASHRSWWSSRQATRSRDWSLLMSRDICS
jgi:uncharacterized protein YcsI (UPF0317 family)